MLLIEPNILKLQIDNYFSQVKEAGKFQIGVLEYDEPNPTLTGLAIFLGFSSTSQFKKYRENPEYTEIIEYGLLRIENQYEKLLQSGVANAKIGLKRVGSDWEDSSTISHSFTFADMVKRASECVK